MLLYLKHFVSPWSHQQHIKFTIFRICHITATRVFDEITQPSHRVTPMSDSIASNKKKYKRINWNRYLKQYVVELQKVLEHHYSTYSVYRNWYSILFWMYITFMFTTWVITEIGIIFSFELRVKQYNSIFSGIFLR